MQTHAKFLTFPNLKTTSKIAFNQKYFDKNNNYL